MPQAKPPLQTQKMLNRTNLEEFTILYSTSVIANSDGVRRVLFGAKQTDGMMPIKCDPGSTKSLTITRNPPMTRMNAFVYPSFRMRGMSQRKTLLLLQICVDLPPT
jgi:hypothetical protein